MKRWHVLWAILFGFLASAATAELTESEQRGREIYLRGTSPIGARIVARIGPDGVEVPASVLTCVSCHGADGRGGSQGEPAAADLRWPTLSASLQADGAGERQRPPYDAERLRQAITRGVDAAGQPLHITMPRYRLTRRDAEDLIAYLRQLGSDQVPGTDR